MIISGKKLQEEVLLKVKSSVGQLGFTPVVYDVVAGNDPVQEKFVSIKQTVAKGTGIDFKIIRMDDLASEEEYEAAITDAAKEENVCGIIIQLPLPGHLDRNRILSMVPNELDIDGLSPDNEWWESSRGRFVPPVALAVEHILSSVETDKDKQIVVLGRGNLVGVPTVKFLTKKGWTAASLDAGTEEALSLVKSADILICGTGKPHLVKGEHIKPGAIVIDAGTSESGGKIVGDVETESVAPIAAALAAVPGGVGPVTVAMLLRNVVLSAKHRKSQMGKTV